MSRRTTGAGQHVHVGSPGFTTNPDWHGYENAQGLTAAEQDRDAELEEFARWERERERHFGHWPANETGVYPVYRTSDDWLDVAA